VCVCVCVCVCVYIYICIYVCVCLCVAQHHLSQPAGNLLLDFAPGPDGFLPANAVARYKEIGDWVRACYGSPVVSGQGIGVNVSIAINGTVIDRAVIREDQAFGERIRAYSILARTGSTWTTLASGSSVGNKRIEVFGSARAVDELKLSITSASDEPVVLLFAAYSPTHC
jgi:alpha-L-fucosidase